MFRAFAALLTGPGYRDCAWAAAYSLAYAKKNRRPPRIPPCHPQRAYQAKSQYPDYGRPDHHCRRSRLHFLWAKLNNPFIQKAIILVLWFGGLGAVDDWLKLTAESRHRSRDGLKPWEKILFQFGGAVLIASFLYIDFTNIEDGRKFWLPFYKHGIPLANWMFILIAIMYLSATSNAVNLTDGMDGLAAGCIGYRLTRPCRPVLCRFRTDGPHLHCYMVKLSALACISRRRASWHILFRHSRRSSGLSLV